MIKEGLINMKEPNDSDPFLIGIDEKTRKEERNWEVFFIIFTVLVLILLILLITGVF